MNENPFWQFSLEFYAQAGVPALCLELQDDFNADVNIVLFCCWLGINGCRLKAENMVEVLVMCDEWRERCVVPLRQVRRFMKQRSDCEPLRMQVKTVELEAERYQQNFLYQFALSTGLSAKPLELENYARENLHALLCDSREGLEHTEERKVAVLIDRLLAKLSAFKQQST